MKRAKLSEAEMVKAYYDAIQEMPYKQRAAVRERVEGLLCDEGHTKVGAYRKARQALCFCGVEKLPARVFAFVVVFGTIPHSNGYLTHKPEQRIINEL